MEIGHEFWKIGMDTRTDELTVKLKKNIQLFTFIYEIYSMIRRLENFSWKNPENSISMQNQIQPGHTTAKKRRTDPQAPPAKYSPISWNIEAKRSTDFRNTLLHANWHYKKELS